MSSLVRGLAAGAVGTTVLNAVTHLDTTLTGRPASSAPVDTVLAAADRVGIDLPSGPGQETYGALAGLGVGLGVGAVAALVRSAGIRLPFLAETAVIGLGAMAATDGPMAAMEVTHLSTWSGTDWARDVVPHLVYGAAVSATLRALTPAPSPPSRSASAFSSEESETQTGRKPRVLLRSLAVGMASGARTSLGLMPSALGVGSRTALASASLVVSEMVVDKLPMTPSRVAAGPAVGRIGAGALGAAAIAHQSRGSVVPAVLVGAAGAVLGTLVGAFAREAAAERGWTWQAAAVEDVAALALTAYAWRT